MIEGKKDGQFYALKRIICHDDKAKEEALEVNNYYYYFSSVYPPKTNNPVT